MAPVKQIGTIGTPCGTCSVDHQVGVFLFQRGRYISKTLPVRSTHRGQSIPIYTNLSKEYEAASKVSAKEFGVAQ